MITKILLVEDHSFIANIYTDILMRNRSGVSPNIVRYSDCESAYHAIVDCFSFEVFDFVFLDYSLPVYEAKNINNRLDLGVLIQQQMPKAKIIMITGFADSIKLREVVEKIAPNGFIIKSDINNIILENAINFVLEGKTFYSPQVYKSIGHPLLSQGVLDNIDQKIIVLLSQGLQTISIASRICMSVETVKKRKAKIKEALGLPHANKEQILKKCRDEGLITNFI